MAYVIVEGNVKNPEILAQYSQQAAATLAKFSGKFIAKGAAEALHGKAEFAIRAVIEFASVQAAKNWYFSPEYQALNELRELGMESRFVVTEAI
ncbi:DUF1330 domain-containing protein [Salinibius halmophilus]|uniref:DUF1330 domain-containing protein n=1 Tax=Salinibius halmophilus TaxID=1853216 RepID=UPI000E671E91|nr:DUF1330 domain-containing protein [Salinibius halmophilus]